MIHIETVTGPDIDYYIVLIRIDSLIEFVLTQSSIGFTANHYKHNEPRFCNILTQKALRIIPEAYNL
jgi:hypothetical protein